jgi:uncharacterized protein (DUF1800 family)
VLTRSRLVRVVSLFLIVGTAFFWSPGSLGKAKAIVAPVQAPITFSDVPPTYPFYTEITNLGMRGITLGCAPGLFCPEGIVTREQMAAFIIRALGMPNPPAPGSQRFADVPPDNPFYAFIEEMAVRGITLGCGGGNYCPSATVTREQMAAFIMRAAGLSSPPTPASQRFVDVPPANPFYAFIEQMALRGVTAGCGAGNYCPTGPVTRAAMAAFLIRGFGLRDLGPPGTSVGNASRFLEQATWGATPQLLAHVQQVGIRAYLDEQFAIASSGYPSMALQPTTVPSECDSNCQRDFYSMYPLQRTFFTNAFYADDQLRQRATWALHKIIVVSGRDLMQPSWMVPYLQTLDRNVFGSYRTLLGEITLNPAMGAYLNMMTSTRTNPNENYPREVLQLFSIGTEKLNGDGTPILDPQGVPLPTYDQEVITGFTKIFTGWRLAAQPSPGVANYIDPMVLVTNNHDTSAKLLLDGVTQPASQTGDQDLTAALNNIFAHPNVGPYICKQLIKQTVTSNPSPAYVERVANVFNNNGLGARGDLKAVWEAIFLDPEARGDLKADVTYGRLREPAQLINNIARAFGVRAANGTGVSDGYLNPQAVNMDQDVLRPPTVFSYFAIDFLVPNGGGLVGPEFGILSASTALRRANFFNTIVFSTIGTSNNAPNGTSIDLSGLQALAGTPAQLVEEVNQRLLYGRMSSEMRTSITTAVTAVSSTNTLKRARTALYLVASSSQYQVQR